MAFFRMFASILPVVRDEFADKLFERVRLPHCLPPLDVVVAHLGLVEADAGAHLTRRPIAQVRGEVAHERVRVRLGFKVGLKEKR
jgi:hypothetical protein